MADEFEEAAPAAEEQTKTPEEQAFLNALHQRKVIADALKEGTLSCLPGADGYADTEPAVNVANGTRYHGATQLYLKEFQKQNGFPTAEYMTQEAVQKSGIPIRQGQHGVTVSFQTKNEETGKWEQKNARLFNVAQSVKPAELKAYAARLIEEKAQEKIDYLKKQYGENYRPPERKERGPAPEIACSSTEPEKYLGEYLAAVSMGGKFKVTPEQKSEFAHKMETSLFERGENGHTNPFKLSKICNAAGDHCKEVIRQARAEQFPKQEQTQEQNRGRGR
jgi:ABC-type transporter MlaC component